MDDKLSADILANLSNNELVKISHQITGRLHNEDWQKVVHDLRTSGHIHTFRESAPPMLQRFLRLEIDLDEELSKQGAAAPLMSAVSLKPRRPRGDEQRLVAEMSGQDAGATVHVEVYPENDLTLFLFGLEHMLTLRFRLPKLDLDERRQYLDLMHRDDGIVILWTRERWERDYLVFIKQEFFTRVYAYSGMYEATTRMTNEVVGGLMDWLERCWFPRTRDRRRHQRTTTVLNVFDPMTEAAQGVSQIADQIATGKDKTASGEIQVSEEELQRLRAQLAHLVDSGRTILRRAAAEDGDVLRKVFEDLDKRAKLPDRQEKPVQPSQPEKQEEVTVLAEEDSEAAETLMKSNPAMVSRIREKLKELLAAQAAESEGTDVDKSADQSAMTPDAPEPPDSLPEALPEDSDPEDDKFKW